MVTFKLGILFPEEYIYLFIITLFTSNKYVLVVHYYENNFDFDLIHMLSCEYVGTTRTVGTY